MTTLGRGEDSSHSEDKASAIWSVNQLLSLQPKRSWIVGGLVLVALWALWFISPYWALWGIQDAVATGDSAALESRIDFPALRQNLKEQAKAQIAGAAIEEDKLLGFGLLAVGLAGGFVDNIIDGFVTPSGLARLAAGSESGDTKMYSVGSDFLNRQDYAIHRGLNSFAVHMQTSERKEFEILFECYGLRWILVNVILPDVAWNELRDP